MLIRFAIQNVFSFGQMREFNMLPYKRLQTLSSHVYEGQRLSLLKMGGIYGANASGKSNLVKALYFFQQFVARGTYPFKLKNSDFKFEALDGGKQTLAAEFIQDSETYLYAVQLLDNKVYKEELYKSGLGRGEDILVYEVSHEDTTEAAIRFHPDFEASEKGALIKEVLASEFIRPERLSLQLLSNRGNTYFDDCKKAYQWFTETLLIIHPSSKPTALPERIDKSSAFKAFAEDLMRSFDLGICSLDLEKMTLDEFLGEDEEKHKLQIKESLTQNPKAIVKLQTQGNNELIVTKEGEDFFVKKLLLNHQGAKERVAFDLDEESDGTIRLLDLIPAFMLLSQVKKVCVIDEIERSIHPLLIKKLIEKFSLDEGSKGQLVFTTHESNLLDQQLFRQDEIWLVEKDKLGQTDLYPLSKFKEHKTIDIQKGYLSGRYGGIPFLGNLEDLNWHAYDIEEQTV